MVAKLLQLDDISYPEELIVKFQGMDKLRAFRNEISVPIDQIESITVIDPAYFRDEHGIVEVTGVGAGSHGRTSKVGTRKSLEQSSGKEKKAVKGKAMTVLLRLRRERNKELSFEVNDVESEKVIKVLLEMFDEASYPDRY